MKNATSLGRSALATLAFFIKMAARVSSSGGSMATVSPQPNRDLSRSSSPSTSFRIPVTGQHDLLLVFQQGVERVKELLLRALLARKKLDIVDQQRIHRAIEPLELVDGVVLQRRDHIRHKALGVQVHHVRIRVVGDDGVTDGMHQVRLAQDRPRRT